MEAPRDDSSGLSARTSRFRMWPNRYEDKERTVRKKLIIAIIIAALAAGGAWWYRAKKAGETTTTVKTARAELGTLTVVASATGGVQADLQVEIKSRAAGEVIELAVEPGHQVREGEVIEEFAQPAVRPLKR